jgi:hypothetical protein
LLILVDFLCSSRNIVNYSNYSTKIIPYPSKKNPICSMEKNPFLWGFFRVLKTAILSRVRVGGGCRSDKTDVFSTRKTFWYSEVLGQTQLWEWLLGHGNALKSNCPSNTHIPIASTFPILRATSASPRLWYWSTIFFHVSFSSFSKSVLR